VEKLYWFEAKEGSESFKIGIVRRVTMLKHLRTEEESEVVEGDPAIRGSGSFVYWFSILEHSLKNCRMTGRIQNICTRFTIFVEVLGEYVTSNYHAIGFSKGVPISWDGVYV